MAYILYNKKGKEITLDYGVDYLEALKTGEYFETDPTGKIPPVKVVNPNKQRDEQRDAKVKVLQDKEAEEKAAIDKIAKENKQRDDDRAAIAKAKEEKEAKDKASQAQVLKDKEIEEKIAKEKAMKFEDKYKRN